jgi:iron complex transport system ATP-binding protein
MLMVTHRVGEITPGFTHALLLRRGRVSASGLIGDVLTDEIFSAAMEIEVRLEMKNGRRRAVPA